MSDQARFGMSKSLHVSRFSRAGMNAPAQRIGDISRLGTVMGAGVIGPPRLGLNVTLLNDRARHRENAHHLSSPADSAGRSSSGSPVARAVVGSPAPPVREAAPQPRKTALHPLCGGAPTRGSSRCRMYLSLRSAAPACRLDEAFVGVFGERCLHGPSIPLFTGIDIEAGWSTEGRALRKSAPARSGVLRGPVSRASCPRARAGRRRRPVSRRARRSAPRCSSDRARPGAWSDPRRRCES